MSVMKSLLKNNLTINNQQSIEVFEQNECMFTNEDKNELVHDTMFYNVYLSLSFLHDYKTDVKLDEDSNYLIRDEQHSSMGTILILSHYYDKENVLQCLQDNDYIKDYAENFC
jgi:hypothetical protein